MTQHTEISRICAGVHQRGLSLIELMVAMTIGAVLIFGATQVYVNSRNSYGVNESVARLQETARYAMAVIEPDIRMANYWGLVNSAPAAIAAPGTALACGAIFAVDVRNNLQGSNNAYQLDVGAPACDSVPDFTSGVAWATNAVTTADTLTVRRAAALPVVPSSVTTAGVMQICSNRSTGVMEVNGAACLAPPTGQINDLIVNAYYIDRNSAQQANLPSLRRKTLSSVQGGVPRILDQEIIPGVEDMQIQFGIDPTGNTGVVTRYVNPDAVPFGALVVAVRVWLLVRSDTAESGFTDARIYQYGDRVGGGATGDLNSVAAAGVPYQPSQNPDASVLGPQHVRRLLMSRTIFIRNALDN